MPVSVRARMQSSTRERERDVNTGKARPAGCSGHDNAASLLSKCNSSTRYSRLAHVCGQTLRENNAIWLS